jgi:peroxiredoxin
MAQDYPALTLGDEAPAFTLRTSEGEEVQLSDILRSRTAIIVFIRGTW